MKFKPLPSQEYLNRCLEYNQTTGELTWSGRPRSHFKCDHGYKTFIAQKKGRPAGCSSDGYIILSLDGTRYQAHRIIWKIMTGDDPKCLVDHKDCNGLNNIWLNLRLATIGQNNINNTRRVDNKSGFPVRR